MLSCLPRGVLRVFFGVFGVVLGGLWASVGSSRPIIWRSSYTIYRGYLNTRAGGGCHMRADEVGYPGYEYSPYLGHREDSTFPKDL